MINKIYLLLGSNIGNREQKFAQAKKHIDKKLGKIIRQSKLYQTAAWGKTDQADFLNQVIIIESRFSADKIMSSILDIEEKLGRIRTEKNAPRTIDIDILFFNKDIIRQNNLSVPHPEIQNRRFVLIPLNELSPNLKHPVFNKSIHYLLKKSKDKLDVKKY